MNSKFATSKVAALTTALHNTKTSNLNWKKLNFEVKDVEMKY